MESGKIFESELGYSIILPKNWSEYEDELNTNAFFDTTNWTGNLRITPITFENINPELFIKNEIKNSKFLIDRFITKNNNLGFKYSEQNEENHIYYWYIFVKNIIFICSFTIDVKRKKNVKNEVELLKIFGIIETIKLK